MRRGSLPTTLKLLGALALVQGVLGILRALHLFQVGSDLSRSGLLLLPILGFVAVARGGLVIAIAALYVLFAWGVFGRRPWARAIGLAACALNVLAVLGLVLTGEPLAAALFWIVVPVILAAYLLGAPGRRALAP